MQQHHQSRSRSPAPSRPSSVDPGTQSEWGGIEEPFLKAPPPVQDALEEEPKSLREVLTESSLGPLVWLAFLGIVMSMIWQTTPSTEVLILAGTSVFNIFNVAFNQMQGLRMTLNPRLKKGPHGKPMIKVPLLDPPYSNYLHYAIALVQLSFFMKLTDSSCWCGGGATASAI